MANRKQLIGTTHEIANEALSSLDSYIYATQKATSESLLRKTVEPVEDSAYVKSPLLDARELIERIISETAPDKDPDEVNRNNIVEIEANACAIIKNYIGGLKEVNAPNDTDPLHNTRKRLEEIPYNIYDQQEQEQLATQPNTIIL